MDIAKVRELTDAELGAELVTQRRNLYDLRFQLATRQLTDHSQLTQRAAHHRAAVDGHHRARPRRACGRARARRSQGAGARPRPQPDRNDGERREEGVDYEEGNDEGHFPGRVGR